MRSVVSQMISALIPNGKSAGFGKTSSSNVLDRGYGSGVWIMCGPGPLIHTLFFEPQPHTIQIKQTVARREITGSKVNVSSLQASDVDSNATPGRLNGFERLR